MNARTGCLADYITSDNIKDNFTDCPLPPNYIPDIEKPRNKMDMKNNLHGSLLANLCKNHEMRIMNGRFLGDSMGYYTFFNSNGKSTIDYMPTTVELMHDVKYFNVMPPNKLSDHCIISTGIVNRQKNLKSHQNECNPLPGKYLWSEESKDRYILHF